MKILMIDVGGTNVKLMASGHEGRRKVPSGRKLTADDMVKEVLNTTKDWEFEAVSLGYPRSCGGRTSERGAGQSRQWLGGLRLRGSLQASGADH